MSYFKVGEPYYKIGDWVNIILPEYGRKTIWKIIEIEFSPGELPIVKLKNVFYYDETVETTIDNIRPIQYLKKQNNKIEIKTVNNPRLEAFKKIFPDYYNHLIRGFLFDESLFNVFNDMTKRERNMSDLNDSKLIVKPFTFNIDILYDKIREESEGERDMYYLACDIKTKNIVACYTNIKNVIFNDPATIIFWKDGSKTVVKCGPDEKYDPEKGMAMAIAKRVYGTSETGGNYYNIFKEWLPEEKAVLNFE